MSRATSRKFGKLWLPVPRVPLARSMRPASCSSAAPSATNTSVMEARCSAKLLSLFSGRVGSYIPGCGRRLVAISWMPSSTDLARSAAPDIFLPSATCRMPEARSRNDPQATYRVNNSGPWVEAYCARLRQTALARNVRSFSRWASYKHHAMLVCFLRPFRVKDSNSFRRMRCNSCVNSPNSGGWRPRWWRIFVHGPFVAIRPLMFHQAGFAGPTNRAVAEGCLDMVTPTGLPADPASETPLVRCWWRYLDP